MSVSYGPKLGLLINALTGDAHDVAFRALLRALDQVLFLSVKSRTIIAPPGSPANGDAYIVATGGTGAWSAHDKSIAVWSTDNPAALSGEWEFYVPAAGWLAFSVADAAFYSYSGTAWTAFGGGGGSSTLAADTDVVIASPFNNDVLTYETSSTKWKNKPASGGGAPTAIAGVNNQTGTSYVLVLGDAGFLVRMNNAAANTCTVPPNSSVAFPLDTVIMVRQLGAGTTTIVAGAGVTINSPASLDIARKNETIYLVQVATDTWDLAGDVAALPPAPVFVTSVAAQDTSFSPSITTAAIDTTGANFLVAILSAYDGAAVHAFTDSKGNTWHQAVFTSGTPAFSYDQRHVVYYAYNATCGAGHTFTHTVSGGLGDGCPGIVLMAFSGMPTTDPHEAYSGAQPWNQLNGGLTLQAAIDAQSPLHTGDLVITGLSGTQKTNPLSIDSGFTVAAQPAGAAYIGVGGAYKIATSTAALNPTWGNFASSGGISNSSLVIFSKT